MQILTDQYKGVFCRRSFDEGHDSFEGAPPEPIAILVLDPLLMILFKWQ